MTRIENLTVEDAVLRIEAVRAIGADKERVCSEMDELRLDALATIAAGSPDASRLASVVLTSGIDESW